MGCLPKIGGRLLSSGINLPSIMTRYQCWNLGGVQCQPAGQLQIEHFYDLCYLSHQYRTTSRTEYQQNQEDQAEK